MRIPRQFTLRLLFALMTLVAVFYAIKSKRQRDEIRLANFISQYNQAMDNRQYDEAERVANTAAGEFDHPIFKQLIRVVELRRQSDKTEINMPRAITEPQRGGTPP